MGQLLVSDVLADARCYRAASRVDRNLLCGTHRSDLRVRAGDRKSILAICLRLDVSHARTPAGFRTPAYRKRRPQAWRASGRCPVARLLDTPFRAGFESDRSYIPDGR